MNKEEKIIFRASAKEKDLIKSKAKEANLTMSDYIRTCALGSHIIKTTVETVNE